MFSEKQPFYKGLMGTEKKETPQMLRVNIRDTLRFIAKTNSGNSNTFKIAGTILPTLVYELDSHIRVELTTCERHYFLNIYTAINIYKFYILYINIIRS